MKYDSPELRDKLAAEYVLGTMPALVRRRFERLMASDPELVRVVEDWSARFGPIDGMAPAHEPPARIWRAVERQLALPPAAKSASAGWLGSLAFWRMTALAASAVAAAVILYVAIAPAPPANRVVAILSDDKGDPGWVALGDARGDVAVAPVGKIAADAAHAFELWAITDGLPRPLGLLAPEPGHSLSVQASLVPPGSILAVSVEPHSGSPTGLPTGPVLYKGKILPREP
jgi:anti-sigma-K factor RskA